MKRGELMKRIGKIAKGKGETVELTEGGSHTKVRIGDRQTTVPRHSEVNEFTARGILEYLEGQD